MAAEVELTQDNPNIVVRWGGRRWLIECWDEEEAGSLVVKLLDDIAQRAMVIERGDAQAQMEVGNDMPVILCPPDMNETEWQN